MSCAGETTESMIKGSRCAPGGSQYDNAVSFVTAHRGDIALITISIGGNDVVPCMSRTNAATCFEDGLPMMKANISRIVAGLRAATGSDVPIVGMNLYDPLLGDWLSAGTGRSLALAANAGVAN
jgi:lysophospholipase L1-like esterase